MTYGHLPPRLVIVPAGQSGRAHEAGFTVQDLMALSIWIKQSDGHGYRRFVVEKGSGRAEPENGGYVLIYTPESEWARWGVARCRDVVLVWHCRDGADLGRFPTMIEALDGLPPVWSPPRGVHPHGPQPFRGPMR